MPLYEYRCKPCKQDFELLIRSGDQPVCPSCGSRELDKQWSLPAAPSIAGGRLPTHDAAPTCGRPQCGSGCMFGE
jgi:putative FmdB family regulatory protein